MTKEEKKQKNREASIRWYHKNKEKCQEIARKRYHKNKEKELIRHKEYVKTPMGRASYLVSAYKREDTKYNRGECTLTARWVVENIFTKPCVHCGKTGWDVIGCNRLDNSKPHTMDNVEPCCKECNDKLAHISRQKRLDQIDEATGEVIASFASTKDAAKILLLNESSINRCCNGGYFDKRKNKWINVSQYKNFIWKRY